MRLSRYEIDPIKKAFYEIFEDGKIYLFGGRLDDTKRDGILTCIFKQSIKIIYFLKRLIFWQKIKADNR